MNPFDVTIELLRTLEATDASGAVFEIDAAIDVAVELFRERAARAALFAFIGNGASQSIASHMAADLLKNGGVRALAFTDSSLLTCVGNDLGFEQLFAEPIRRLCADGDVLVAISSSGRSANVLAGVSAARGLGMGVVTLSGFDADNPLRSLGDINFWVPSHHYGDVEVIHAAIGHRILDGLLAGEY